MAVRYTIPFKDFGNQQWRIDVLDNVSDAGAPVFVRGNGKAGVLTWQPDNVDDPFACYKASTLTINCIQEGQINLDELEEAQDREFTVKIYRNGQIYWQGFVIPDGVQYTYLSAPFNFSFTAICGLNMLQDIPYVHTDMAGITATISRCPMNYIRDILFNVLGNTLPIRWTNTLVNSLFNDEIFTGRTQWGADGQAFLTYNGTSNDADTGIPQTCDYILSGILSAMQCCIYLDNGRWNIRRITDLTRLSIPYRQVAANTGVMTVVSGTDNILNQIGRFGLPFINEDPLITTRKGIKTCRVTYQANVRNNIVPNGGQDLRDPITDLPIYWDIYHTPNDVALPSRPNLDVRPGFSSSIIFQGDGFDPDEWFTMFTGMANPLGKIGLPVDTAIMIPYIIFGFQFEIVLGFPAHLGVIDWTTEPFRIKVIYNTGGQQFFLNRYGFWVNADTYIPIVVDGLSENDVAQIDFNAFQNVPMPTPSGTIVAGFENNIQILFRVASGQHYKLDNIYLNIQSGNDVYESTLDSSKNTTIDKRTLNISSSFGGYMLSNFMTSPFNSGDECYFKDAAIYEGSLTGLTANAIMRCCYKSSKIFNGSINTKGQTWNFDSIYNIDGFGTKRFLPLGASYNIEQCQVNNLVAIEIRNDSVNLSEKYYNSNTA